MTGRLTLPTDADVIDETLRLKNLLGADALRDCDGTEMPEELLSEPVKKYATYYTTRKDNENCFYRKTQKQEDHDHNGCRQQIQTADLPVRVSKYFCHRD